MKKIFLFSLLFVTTQVVAATPWWEQPTVCRINPANCYTSTGAGYDSGMWDAVANCWGMKMICGEALTNSNDARPVGRTEISRGTNINADYDLSVLNNDCFGVRKTSTDGSMASVNGQMVRVWCTGILSHVDEVIENGEITYGTQPNCQTLAADGYVAVSNDKCYGKYYDPARYYIQCAGETPTLIVLNGANYETGNTSYPETQEDADAIFNRMYNNVHGTGQIPN